MLSLPIYQKHSYEPLVAASPTIPASPKAAAAGIMGRFQQRKVQLLFALVGIFGCIQLLRISMSHNGIQSSTANGFFHPWNVSKTVDTPKLPPSVPLLGNPSIKKPSVDSDVKAAPKIPMPVLAPEATAIIPSIKAPTGESYRIAESDWHIPSDVDKGDITLLKHTRYRPFFRQEKEDVHREKGFGVSVHLKEAHFVRRSLYRHLLQALHTFSEQHDFHFWLAHGTLIGQKWGQKIMTGDTDVDVQTSLGSLHRVKKYENQLWEDRFELLVNPHYLIRKTQNTNGLGRDKNVIDARWIDTMTGYYIDITALSSEQANDYENDNAPFIGDKTTFILQDKSPHTYPVDAISPTKKCRFEGMDLWCPNDIENVLDEEYKAHTLPHYHTWRFNSTIQTFTEVDCPALIEMYRFPTKENCDEECRYIVSRERRILYRALVITGPPLKKGCMIKISFKDDDGVDQVREYWAREVVGQMIDHQNMRNNLFPPMTPA